jgi:hypothetical protein
MSPAKVRGETPTVDALASEADDRAAQLAMEVESIADACELVARHVAELRVDVARERILLDELRKARRLP